VHGAYYNALSARNFSLNIRTEHATFRTPYSKQLVHGSWIRETAWTVRTTGGRIISTSFEAHQPRSLFVAEKGQREVKLLVEGGRMTIDNLRIELRKRTLTVRTHEWLTTAESTVAFPHPNRLRMNIRIQPLTQSALVGGVWPHGLLGQTFDGDGVAMSGDIDKYVRTGKAVDTQAQAQGAIEGRASDYLTAHRFATDFKYSRFDSVIAPHRDISRLREVDWRAQAPAWNTTRARSGAMISNLNFQVTSKVTVESRGSCLVELSASSPNEVSHRRCPLLSLCCGRAPTSAAQRGAGKRAGLRCVRRRVRSTQGAMPSPSSPWRTWTSTRSAAGSREGSTTWALNSPPARSAESSDPSLLEWAVGSGPWVVGSGRV